MRDGDPSMRPGGMDRRTRVRNLEGSAVLEGKTVWVVEPEHFSAYALERRLRDMRADRVVLVHDAREARARLVLGDTPTIAIVDCAERPMGGRDLAADLRRRDVAVVCTVDERGTGLNGTGRHDGLDCPTTYDVPKPYAMIDVERAIARHYGLTI